MIRRLGYLFIVVICGLGVGLVPADAQSRYVADNGNFPNPERGFYHQDAPMWYNDALNPQSVAYMTGLRAEGISMVRWYFLIDEFVSTDFDTETLAFIDSQFDAARTAGMKVIPRFAYNFPQGGTYPYDDPDATLEQTLTHIGQLGDVLADNVDVIAFMELGFVGAWGEWHSSTNGHVDEETGINDNSRTIVAAILEALPAERMVAMRYGPYKQQLYGDTPLTAEQAFGETPQARMGAHNDCFLASFTDWGTYPSDPQARAALRQYLSTDNQYVPQGGETCNFGADAQPYIGCSNALKDLKLLRFSVLNVLYHPDVLDYWKDNGCYNTIAKRLGYRLGLVDVPVMSSQALTGDIAHLTVILKNTGFAAPYNPRGFEIILRSHADGALYRPTLLATPDPRRWLPNLGEITLDLSLQLPNDIPAGGYDVLLNLPDPAPALYGRPEYSIRLATKGVWDATTGFNDLLVDMTITTPIEGETTDLLVNGGFEDGLTAWRVNRPAGKPDNDKVVCGGVGAVGDCAFVFKGGAGENTRLTQTVTLTNGQLAVDDVLSVSARYSTHRAANLLSFKVIATTAGGQKQAAVALPASHFTRTTLAANPPTYQLRLGGVPPSLTGTPPSTLTLQIRYKSPAGKLYLDDVRLTITAPSTRGLWPLPSAP